jgi:hypothetical protein
MIDAPKTRQMLYDAAVKVLGEKSSRVKRERIYESLHGLLSLEEIDRLRKLHGDEPASGLRS